MASTSDVMALVMVPTLLGVGLWAVSNQLEGTETELSEQIGTLLGTNFEVAGIVLILLVIATIVVPILGWR